MTPEYIELAVMILELWQLSLNWAIKVVVNSVGLCYFLRRQEITMIVQCEVSEACGTQLINIQKIREAMGSVANKTYHSDLIGLERCYGDNYD